MLLGKARKKRATMENARREVHEGVQEGEYIRRCARERRERERDGETNARNGIG